MQAVKPASHTHTALAAPALQVSYPISNGIVQNWDDMYHVWDHTFSSQLKVDPTDSCILLTDPPLNPRSNRERLFQTMFERYGFVGAYIQIQAVLTLYAQGEAAGTGQHCCFGVSSSTGLLAHQETPVGAFKGLQMHLSKTLNCSALRHCGVVRCGVVHSFDRSMWPCANHSTPAHFLHCQDVALQC